MCKLNEKYEKEGFIGWKVVIDKDGNFFSPAMGCQYPMKGKVPIVRKQKSLCNYFIPNILGVAKSKGMYGRTAAFVTDHGAINLRRNLINAELSDFKWSLKVSDIQGKTKSEEFSKALEKKIRIVKVKLTQDLMRGEYGTFVDVVAGKHIEFLDKPKSVNKKG